MPITAECPLCATKGQVPSSFSGKRVKCPKCCNLFVVTGPTSQSALGNQKLPGSNPGAKMSGSKAGQGTVKPGSTHHGTTKPSGGTNHGTTPKPGGSHAGNQKLSGSGQGNQKTPGNSSDFRRSSPPTQEIPAFDPDEVLGRRRPGNELQLNGKPRAGKNPLPLVVGVLALFVGLSAAAICWIPEVAIYGSYLALGGLAIGGFGMLLGYVMHNGVVLSGIASGLCVVAALCGFIFAVDSPDNDKKEGNNPTQQTSPLPDTRPDTRPDPVVEEWVMAPNVARVGDVRIKVTGVEIDTVKGKDGKPLNPREQQTIVKLVVENGGKDKVNYRGAADPGAKVGEGAPRLTDDQGTPYRVVDFGKDKPIPGQLEVTSLAPEKPVVDVLVFMRAPENAPYLRLELAGANFAGAGKVKIKIPRALVIVKEPPPKDPPPDDKTIQQLLAELKNPGLRMNAVSRIGQLGPKGAAAVPDLVNLLKEGDPNFRAAVVEALGRIGPSKSALPGLLNALKDPIPKVRGNAAEALGHYGADAKPHLGALIALFRDPDEEVSRKALEAVRQLEGSK